MAWWETVDWQDPINRSCSLNSGLVGWWMGTPLCFGGTRMVDLLNSYNAAFAGGFTPATQWSSTAYGPAIRLSGSGGYCSVGNVLDITTDQLTLAAVATPAATSQDGMLITRDNGTVDTQYSLQTNTAGGGQFAFRISTTSGASNIQGTASTAGVRRLVVGVVRGNAMELYLDGSLVASSTIFGTLTSRAVNLEIGSRNGGQFVFNGTIESARVWNIGKTAAEVAALAGDWRRGFQDTLNHIDDPLRYAEQVAAGGFKAAWAIRQQQVIGGGLGL